MLSRRQALGAALGTVGALALPRSVALHWEIADRRPVGPAAVPLDVEQVSAVLDMYLT